MVAPGGGARGRRARRAAGGRRVLVHGGRAAVAQPGVAVGCGRLAALRDGPTGPRLDQPRPAVRAVRDRRRDVSRDQRVPPRGRPGRGRRRRVQPPVLRHPPARRDALVRRRDPPAPRPPVGTVAVAGADRPVGERPRRLRLRDRDDRAPGRDSDAGTQHRRGPARRAPARMGVGRGVSLGMAAESVGRRAHAASPGPARRPVALSRGTRVAPAGAVRRPAPLRRPLPVARGLRRRRGPPPRPPRPVPRPPPVRDVRDGPLLPPLHPREGDRRERRSPSRGCSGGTSNGGRSSVLRRRQLP